MKVGPYELVGSLGRGATSEVFRGRGADGGVVAIKVFSHRTGAPEALERFSREVRLQRALGAAEGVVPILDAGETALGAWLAMPLLGGGPLRDRLNGRPWPVADVVALGRTLAAALGRAHALGIVHRDVKPENILYDDAGRPLLADLGLAKHFRSDVAGASESLVLTRSGALVGTVGYLAPEQASDGRSAGPPADVFSLAAILYEALTGRFAFEGDSPMEVLARLTRAGVEPVRRVRSDVPAWLAATIEQALDQDPGRRHANGAELARALEEGPRAGAPSRRPARAVMAGALLLGAGIGLSAADYRAGQRAEEPARLAGAGVAASDSATAAARGRLRAARLLGEPAAPADVAAVRSLALEVARHDPAEAALLVAEVALGDDPGRPADAEEALGAPGAPGPQDPRRRLLAAFAALARGREDGASFEALARAGTPLALDAQLGAVRAALARSDGPRAVARLAQAARPGAAAAPELQQAVDRARAELRGVQAASQARSGDPGPGLALARGEGLAAAHRLATHRRLALDLAPAARAASPGTTPPGATCPDEVLEALLALDADALAQPGCLGWLVDRTARLTPTDPVRAARSAEVVRRLDDTTPLPPDLGPALDTHAVGALLRGDDDAWLEAALVNLRLGRTGSLFPLGADAARQAAIEALLARWIGGRPDDWAAKLFLVRCLVRGEPPDHTERLARAELLVREVLAAPKGGLARAVTLETHALLLVHQRRWPEGRAQLEAALAAWHPAPDEVLLDLSYWGRDVDPAQSLAWAEQAVLARDARALGTIEPDRPRGLPVEAIDHPRGRVAAQVDARLVLAERALAVGRSERALEVARETEALQSPGPIAATLIRAAVVATDGTQADARALLVPLQGVTGQDREELDWLAPWLVTYTKRQLRRKNMSRTFATDLGVE